MNRIKGAESMKPSGPRGRWLAWGWTVAAALALAGCASVPEGDPDAMAAYEEANDPLEPMNRYFFEVNYAADQLLFKPLAGWYYTALPNPVQDVVRNAMRNLASPVVLANDVFQGEMDRAGITAMRFLINSTIGVAGLFDVASEWGYVYHDEDFGQTLAVHGVNEGPYLVLPILGPSNPRDAVGRVADHFLDPLTYVLPSESNMGRTLVSGIDLRARNLQVLDEVRKGALDYYATIRSLYRQHRGDAIRNGEKGEETTYPGTAKAPDPDSLLFPVTVEESSLDSAAESAALN
jgi:phospholipid-binding lipoprotein MlaA